MHIPEYLFAELYQEQPTELDEILALLDDDNDDEKTIQKLVFTDEKTFMVTDATHRVWLLPNEPTPIRETRMHDVCIADFVFAVLHSQHAASSPPSRRSNSFSPSLHASCLIVVLLVC